MICRTSQVMLLFLYLVITCCRGMSSTDNRRPFYVIAHMVNSVDNIEGVLNSGANAIETDISFSSDGRPTENYHGFPCDWWRYCSAREVFTNYLDYIRLRGTPGSSTYNSTTISLLYLDLKVRDLPSKVLKKAGKVLAQNLVRHLFGNGSADVETPWLVIGVPDLKQVALVKSLFKTLRKSGYDEIAYRLSVDFYYASNIEAKFEAVRSLNVSCPLWLGEGQSNWWSPNYSRLEMLVNLARGTYSANHLSTLIYHWTVDGDTSLRQSLQYDIDGIITNTPDILNRLLQDKEFSVHFRLATHQDVPGSFVVDASDELDYELK